MKTDSYWIAKVKHCAKQTGYTTYLVKRDNSPLVTIAPRPSDIIYYRLQGEKGKYAESGK